MPNGQSERKVTSVMQRFTPEQGLLFLAVRQPHGEGSPEWNGEFSIETAGATLALDCWNELGRLLQGVLNGLGEKAEGREQADEK